MKKLFAMGLMLFGLTGCGTHMVRGAYLQSRSCGYVVAMTNFDIGSDVVISRCMTLQEATDLAAAINKDMGNNWSGRTGE